MFANIYEDVRWIIRITRKSRRFFVPKITEATEWIPAAVFLYLMAHNFRTIHSWLSYRKYSGRNRKNFYRLLSQAF